MHCRGGVGMGVLSGFHPGFSAKEHVGIFYF